MSVRTSLTTRPHTFPPTLDVPVNSGREFQVGSFKVSSGLHTRVGTTLYHALPSCLHKVKGCVSPYETRTSRRVGTRAPLWDNHLWTQPCIQFQSLI